MSDRTSKTIAERLRVYAPSEYFPHVRLMQEAADKIEWAERIIRRAADWIDIQNVAHTTHKGLAITLEMRRFLAGAADEKSALPPVCVWTQLPDDPNPLELHRVQATTACGGSVMGAYPFYPDNCIYCHKRVAWLAVVGRSAVETTALPTGPQTDWLGKSMEENLRIIEFKEWNERRE